MPAKMAVGHSQSRTPPKQKLLRKVVGRIAGVASTEKVNARRLVFYDLNAGDGEPTFEDSTFWDGTSPGILIGYAAGAHKSRMQASLVILYEIKPKTFEKLIASLTEHLGPPTTRDVDKAQFDYVPRAVATRERDWCPGCGLYWATHNRHREDCLATAEKRIELVARHRGVHVLAFCGDGKNADTRFVMRDDCVFIYVDGNSVMSNAMRPGMVGEILMPTGPTWMCTTLSTLGVNAGGGPKRAPIEERRKWTYDYLESIRAGLPDRSDLCLAAIENDPHQWAYVVTSPIVNDWREKTEQQIRAAFKGQTMRVVWWRRDPQGLAALEDQLFMTQVERERIRHGLFDIKE